MMYKTEICITDPETYTTEIKTVELEPKLGEGLALNEALIRSFFINWDQKDKYSKCYALGVKSIKI